MQAHSTSTLVDMACMVSSHSGCLSWLRRCAADLDAFEAALDARDAEDAAQAGLLTEQRQRAGRGAGAKAAAAKVPCNSWQHWLCLCATNVKAAAARVSGNPTVWLQTLAGNHTRLKGTYM